VGCLAGNLAGASVPPTSPHALQCRTQLRAVCSAAGGRHHSSSKGRARVALRKALLTLLRSHGRQRTRASNRWPHTLLLLDWPQDSTAAMDRETARRMSTNAYSTPASPLSRVSSRWRGQRCSSTSPPTAAPRSSRLSRARCSCSSRSWHSWRRRHSCSRSHEVAPQHCQRLHGRSHYQPRRRRHLHTRRLMHPSLRATLAAGVASPW
jgi:hypothetical protein